MNRKHEIFLLLFVLLVLSLFLIVLLNYDYLKDVISKDIETYGYPAVFIFSFLCDLLEQPISSEIPAAAGYLLGLNIFFVFFVSISASWSASLINFYFGRKVLSKKLVSYCSTEKHKKYCKLFYKYGNLAIFIAAVTPVPYVTFCWISGAFNMKLRNFFVFGLLGKALRTGIILWLAYLAF